MSDSLRAQNIEIAGRVITTCGNLEPEKVRRDFNEDAVLALPYAPDGTPKEVVGREDVIAYVKLLADYLPPGVFTDHVFDTLHDDPGVVVARYAATTRVLTTGLPYQNVYVTFVTVRDGLVTRYEEFFDPLNWLAAQGATVTLPR
jgi:hypothetical protein